MVKTASSPIVQLIRRILNHPGVKNCPDQELLQRFLGERDETAFEAILRRHGAMVFDVCCSVLPNEADAEDAFQAAFLVLARKAGSIRDAATLASWLYGVAYRTALKARAQTSRRSRREAQVPKPELVDPQSVTWFDVRQTLHEELAQLSERYRQPLVLCYLQGRTQAEAATLLRMSEGTIKRRLERARALLRQRLIRRGLGPAGVLLASAWPAGSVSAALPPTLVVSTAKAASAVMAGTAATTVVSAKVAALTEGVMRTMLLTKLKIMTVIVLALSALGVGAGFVTYEALAPAVAGADPPAQASKPDKDKQPNKPAKTDKDKLQGTWIVVSAQFGGKPAPDEFVKSFKLVFVGDKVTVHPSDDGTEGGKDGSFTLDTKKKPKEIDFGGDDKTTKGIYTFEKEQLKLAMAEIGQDRPTEFKSLDGTRHILIVLKRAAEPEKKDEKIGLKPTVFSLGDFMSTLAWDGKTLATASYIHENKDGKTSETCTLRLWDIQKGKERVTFGADPQSRIQSMVFSPDGKTLAVKVERYAAPDLDSLKSYVRIVDVSKGETTQTLLFSGKSGGVAFSPDGKTLAFGGAETFNGDCDTLVVKLWDIERGEEKREFKWEAGTVQVNGATGPASITCLGFSPDGKLLATVQGDHKIKLWNARSGKLNHTLEGHTDHVSAMGFGPDGKTLVSAGKDQKIQLWDPDTGKLQRTLVGNKGRVYSVAFSPDGKTLATSGQIVEDKKYTGEVLLWDAQSGELRRTLPGYESSYPGVVAFARDGETLAVGSRGGAKDGKVKGQVKLWRLSELRAAEPE